MLFVISTFLGLFIVIVRLFICGKKKKNCKTLRESKIEENVNNQRKKEKKSEIQKCTDPGETIHIYVYIYKNKLYSPQHVQKNSKNKSKSPCLHIIETSASLVMYI